MQQFALTEGAFLKHLELSLITTGKDLRILTNRQLSGHLVIKLGDLDPNTYGSSSFFRYRCGLQRTKQLWNCLGGVL